MMLRRTVLIARLAASFLRQLLLSNFAVARVVLARHIVVRPGIVALPTDLRSDISLVILANMITLTPGTLALDLSEDRSTLYVHTLDIDHPEAVVEAIRSSFERYLLELEA